MPASITDFIRCQRLSWAGHVARMADDYGEGSTPRHIVWSHAAGTTTAKEVLQGTSPRHRPPRRLRRKRSSMTHRVNTGCRDDYGEGGPPRHTVWTQAARTTMAKEALQGTPCGRRPPGRLRRRRSSKAYRLDVDRRDDYDEVGPPRHTVWTQATGTPINEVGW